MSPVISYDLPSFDRTRRQHVVQELIRHTACLALSLCGHWYTASKEQIPKQSTSWQICRRRGRRVVCLTGFSACWDLRSLRRVTAVPPRKRIVCSAGLLRNTRPLSFTRTSLPQPSFGNAGNIDLVTRAVSSSSTRTAAAAPSPTKR